MLFYPLARLLFVPIARSAYPTVLVVVLPEEGNLSNPHIITPTDHCLQVTYVTDAVRKVRASPCSALRRILIHAVLAGHWIQDCPTNNDREFDNRPRIKRTTGIPRSFLKAVDNPTTGPLGQGVMVTPEGGYVVAQPDSYVTLVVW